MAEVRAGTASNDRKSRILAEIMRHLSAIETLKRELEGLERRRPDTGMFKRNGLTREQFTAAVRAMESRR